jgi:hypothetical protein
MDVVEAFLLWRQPRAVAQPRATNGRKKSCIFCAYRMPGERAVLPATTDVGRRHHRQHEARVTVTESVSRIARTRCSHVIRTRRQGRDLLNGHWSERSIQCDNGSLNGPRRHLTRPGHGW